jgi:hypothetical protein
MGGDQLQYKSAFNKSFTDSSTRNRILTPQNADS